MILRRHFARLVFVGLLGFALGLAAGRARAATFCINYSATPDAAALREFELSILHPDAQVDVAALQRGAHRC